MAHGQQMLVERVNEYTNTQMIGRYKVRNDKYHRDNRIIVAYIYQDYLLHAFHCSHFMLTVNLEVRCHYYTILQVRTQRYREVE